VDMTQTVNALPSISVVIPTRDRPDDVRRCLDSLTGVAYPHWDILLIDQSTDTRTRAVVGDVARDLPRLTYDPVPWKGLSRARNRGIERTCGEIIAFLDDDCTVGEDWLRRLAAAFARHPDAALVFGAVKPIPYDPANYYILVYEIPEERVLRGRGARPRARGLGAGMYLRRVAAERIGPFDVHLGVGAGRFLSAEDADYAYRALALGCDVVETPAVAIEHYGLRAYGDGMASRNTRENIHAEGALNMKLLRCGDLSALHLIIARGRSHLHSINWANLVTRRGPNGFGRIVMYLRGLYDSFLLPVDRARCLYTTKRERAA